MSATLLLVQTLNGLQFGIILFLIAAGLTLVFGVMDFINLAHGVQYMVGAYFAAAFVAWTGSFAAGLALALRRRSPSASCSRSSSSAISTTAITSTRCWRRSASSCS
jgi:branched-subunit amino acid ABC-type transport system permease component